MTVEGYQLAPPLSDEDRQRLRESIREHGVLIPITVDQDGQLLDGHHRREIATELGVDCPAQQIACSSEEARLAVAATLNADRRQMNDGQRTILGRRLQERYESLARERMVEGGRRRHQQGQDNCPTPEPQQTRDDVAQAVGLGSGRTYERHAKKLDEIEQEAPDLYEQVAAGQADMREANREYRQRRKAERVAEIESAPTPEHTGVYDVLYVDPPWRYDWSETQARQVENHYPTMSLDEIEALEVPADEDALLFLWATSPKLAEAMRVIDAWGFTYRTSLVWVKDRIGMGYYARQRHEFLLVAKRGSPSAPVEGNRPDSVIEAPRSEHSAKPERAYELIEAMFPNARRVELFARSRRDGWDSWGNQAGEAA